LLTEAARHGAHRLRMALRFLGTLRGGAILEEDERPDHLIALLQLIHEPQLQLCKLLRCVHHGSGPRCATARIAGSKDPRQTGWHGAPLGACRSARLPEASSQLSGLTTGMKRR